jgi:hypothetical protein
MSTQAFEGLRRPGWLTFAAIVLISVGCVRVISAIYYFADSLSEQPVSRRFRPHLFPLGPVGSLIAGLALLGGLALRREHLPDASSAHVGDRGDRGLPHFLSGPWYALLCVAAGHPGAQRSRLHFRWRLHDMAEQGDPRKDVISRSPIRRGRAPPAVELPRRIAVQAKDVSGGFTIWRSGARDRPATGASPRSAAPGRLRKRRPTTRRRSTREAGDCRATPAAEPNSLRRSKPSDDDLGEAQSFLTERFLRCRFRP